ncbi:hypothetical protein LtaPh_0301600 [Leishmania tarentolae]|uniref:Uncharacterized protein n=1 Tax=Leishmania tarentolae TaxID=5689 RepID=A0A640KDD0_LEITA|nr:hypothetical protein LtaPh_0301600 [Leishmania tarentolae]
MHGTLVYMYATHKLVEPHCCTATATTLSGGINLYAPEAPAMSSPHSPPPVAVTDSSRDNAALEKDLTQLMRALRLNNSDDWAGKPQQETFAVYKTVPPGGTAKPSSCSTRMGDAARGVPPNDSDNGDASSDSLTALMTDYVHAVRALHACDARAAAEGANESATAEEGHAGDGAVDAKEEATTPCQAVVDHDNSSAADTKHAEALAPGKIAELLMALDDLPPLTLGEQRRQS